MAVRSVAMRPADLRGGSGGLDSYMIMASLPRVVHGQTCILDIARAVKLE